ncbi:MAG: hypothetical protein ACI848_000255 [Roseivirga sp.]|jgi:hypothetical protein
MQPIWCLYNNIFMTINSFFIPTDEDIQSDVKENSRTIKFTNGGSLSQNLEKTVYTRNFMYRFDAEKKEYKISYIKTGLAWKFNGVALVKDQNKKRITKT